MKHIFVIVIVSMFAIGSALAETACETKAIGSDGKPLAGAAKASFLKKCKSEACAFAAVGSDGKPLFGAAKASFLKKCLAEA